MVNHYDVRKNTTRNEMKHVMAGTGGSCQTYNSVEGTWSGCAYDQESAEDFFDGHDEITGWCCASCGEEPFENAEPCTEPIEN